MKNLTSRVRKLEGKKGSAFIVYSFWHGDNQDQVRKYCQEAVSKYLADGGDPDAVKTLVAIQGFGEKIATESKWFYIT